MLRQNIQPTGPEFLAVALAFVGAAAAAGASATAAAATAAGTRAALKRPERRAHHPPQQRHVSRRGEAAERAVQSVRRWQVSGDGRRQRVGPTSGDGAAVGGKPPGLGERPVDAAKGGCRASAV